ncbi:MAG: ATPase [Oscillospiraceae bacterium]|nr:ATPase [Oscillospiraceae bacterium]
MYTFIIPLIIVVLLMLPVIYSIKCRGGEKKARKALIMNICLFFAVMLAAVILPVGEFVVSAEAAEAVSEAIPSAGLGYLGAALAVGLGSIGCGTAVAGAAPAAIGAVSENPKSFGNALIFVALGEGVALYGFLIAFMIINKL